jgi:hypothetical protein
MGLTNSIEKLFDPYDRKARLWPGLLSLLPLITMFFLLYGQKISYLTDLATLICTCGGMFLLANVSREMGKRKETKLYQRWGGIPTTQLLRHRDSNIDPISKSRFHDFLSQKIQKQFPNEQHEIGNPKEADNLYNSAVIWLISNTRDHEKFNIVFQELINYGYKRNSLGLKPIALSVSVICIIWVLFLFNVINVSPHSLFDASAFIKMPMKAMISLAVSFLSILVWVFFFTRERVKLAAFTYATALLKSCDIFEKSETKSTLISVR